MADSTFDLELRCPQRVLLQSDIHNKLTVVKVTLHCRSQDNLHVDVTYEDVSVTEYLHLFQLASYPSEGSFYFEESCFNKKIDVLEESRKRFAKTTIKLTLLDIRMTT
jgi:hypothetical protein